jgi:hypothetical protein
MVSCEARDSENHPARVKTHGVARIFQVAMNEEFDKMEFRELVQLPGMGHQISRRFKKIMKTADCSNAQILAIMAEQIIQWDNEFISEKLRPYLIKAKKPSYLLKRIMKVYNLLQRIMHYQDSDHENSPNSLNSQSDIRNTKASRASYLDRSLYFKDSVYNKTDSTSNRERRSSLQLYEQGKNSTVETQPEIPKPGSYRELLKISDGNILGQPHKAIPIDPVGALNKTRRMKTKIKQSYLEDINETSERT